MRKVSAWLGAAMLFLLVSVRADAGSDVLKPYVVLALDTSDSMQSPTLSGPTTCGKDDRRINHAVCAINNIIASYGEMVFSLGRFRETTSATSGTAGSLVCDGASGPAGLDQNGNVNDTFPPSGGDQCNTQGAYCADCDTTTATAKTCSYCATVGSSAGCTAGHICATGNYCASTGTPDPTTICNGPDRCDPVAAADTFHHCIPSLTGQSGLCTNADANFEVLAPLIDGANASAGKFVDGTCNTCDTQNTGSINPEIWGVGKRTFTPLSGTLAGVKRYWEGNQAAGTTTWATGVCAGGSNVGLACTTNAGCPSSTCNPNLGGDPINRDPTNMVFLTGNSATKCSALASCVKFLPESTCNEASPAPPSADNDSDTKINDGCPTNFGNSSGAESGTQCDNNTDDDGDGAVNDGCPAYCDGVNCCCASQCRPYVTILLTDGAETCWSFGTLPTPAAGTTLANAQALTAMSPRNDRVGITAISGASGTVTVTTVQPITNMISVGDEIQVTGVTGFNTVQRVTAVTPPNTVVYNDPAAPNGSGTLGSSFIGHNAYRNTYNVQMKPIGFGVPAGDQQIEDMAHAGGAADLPGINEGFYAADQSDLQLAISQILADAVRGELCNGKDDDCDEKIDEDFASQVGSAGPPVVAPKTCDNGEQGSCKETGVFQCDATGGVECSAHDVKCVGGSLIDQKTNANLGSCVETCNGIDDNCNGIVDDVVGGCTSTCPGGQQPEICNDKDEDCDGVKDRSCRCSNDANKTCDPSANTCGAACNCTPVLTRPCFIGTGAGQCAGVETCVAGNYQGCTAVSGTEVCDGIDNNCDGVCDGFQVDCSEVVMNCNNANTTSCPEYDNPGSPNHKTCVGGTNKGNACTIAGDCPGSTCDLGFPICVGGSWANQGCNSDADCTGSTNGTCSGRATTKIAQNVCTPGTRACTLSGSCTPQAKTIGNCQGETKPCTGGNCDICDGLDNDCDNRIDEDFSPIACTNGCGTGLTQCINGAISCSSSKTLTDATCDNIDDDCDGQTDEEWTCAVDNVCGQCGVGTLCNGATQCIGGQKVCVGTPKNDEVCNCLDDDCDGIVDEDPMVGVDICPNPAGSGPPWTCVPGACQCADGCAAGEFPCPLDKKCEFTCSSSTTGGKAGSSCVSDAECPGGLCNASKYCINDPCFGVTCPTPTTGPTAGHLQTCTPETDPATPETHLCVDVCDLIENDIPAAQDSYDKCQSGYVCVDATGACKPDTCETFPDRCSQTQTCVNGMCVTNPCANVMCDSDKYCIGGTCVQSCADVTCAEGQRCRQGVCEADPCGKPCPFGQACNDSTGMCKEDPCKDITCNSGQWCNPNDGLCEDDPCETSAIKCPNPGEVCRGGTCLDPGSLRPDAAGEAHVTVGGGGGCNTSGGGSGGVALLLALGLVLARKRRDASSAKRTAGGAS